MTASLPSACMAGGAYVLLCKWWCNMLCAILFGAAACEVGLLQPRADLPSALGIGHGKGVALRH